jgi:hypothetical protein
MSRISNAFNVTVESAPSAPSWYSGLTLNTWTQLANTNTLSSVGANVGPSSSEAVMTAYAGAAFASNFGTFGSMIHWNGGHSDYYGNEVYAFDLNTSTWSMIKGPYTGSMFPPSPVNGWWSDGTPAVPHTYYFVGYRPSTNEFIAGWRATTNQGGGNQPTPSRINLSTKVWVNSSQELPFTIGSDEGCVYDSSRDSLWYVSTIFGVKVGRYSFASDSFVGNYSLSSAVNEGPVVYVPTKDCILRFHTTGGNGCLGIDCTNPSAGTVSIAFTGSGPSSYSYGNMAHWSPNLGKVVWYNSRSNSLYTLTPPSGDWKTQAWTWAAVPMSGTTGTHSGSTGTYGKFQLAHWGSATVAIVNANYNGPCVVAKLS